MEDDTLVFDQGSTDANGGAGQFFLKNTNFPDVRAESERLAQAIAERLQAELGKP